MENLAKLLEQARASRGGAAAWKEIRRRLKDDILEIIEAALAEESDPESPPDIDLAREAARGFWKQAWYTRQALPSGETAFIENLRESAAEAAQRIGADYREFSKRWQECRGGIVAVLKNYTGAEPESMQMLEQQVREDLWYSRHHLQQDCEALASATDRSASEALHVKQALVSGSPQALEDLFVKYRKYMLGVCARTFPYLSADHEDIVHNTFLRLLPSLGRLLQKTLAGKWKPFLRTVAFNACVDYLRRQRRHHA